MAEAEAESAKHPGFARRFMECVRENELPTSQKKLGLALGVSEITARNWKEGEKLPGMANARMLGLRFGVCVEWLLTGRGEKYPRGKSPSTGGFSKYAVRLATIYDTIEPGLRAGVREEAESAFRLHVAAIEGEERKIELIKELGDDGDDSEANSGRAPSC